MSHTHHQHHSHSHSSTITSAKYLEILGLRTLGNFMVFASLFMIGKTLFQPMSEEVLFFLNDITKTTYVVKPNVQTLQPAPTTAPVQPGGFAKLFQTQKVEVLVPEDPQYSVVIPKIGANAPVVANVDPGNETEYLESLKRGIAHAKGTAFPGEGAHIFLFAHSTDYIWNIGSYNAVFYLLYKLERGDEINLFYKGERFVYKVTDRTVINPDQVEYLTKTTNREEVTLQTCWPPGTTLKRLVVTADRVAQ